MRLFQWIFLGLLLLAPAAQAASFDCAQAKTAVEQMICASPTLSRLDEMLAAAYQEAAQAPGTGPELLQRQRRWLRQRAACPSVACLETAYERRITELTSDGDCLRDLATGQCDEMHAKLPRTADGRLMLLSRSECRIGFEGGVKTKNQAEAIQIQADCIEANVYDPCDDGGGRWGAAQCLWANLEVNERRLRKAQRQIVQTIQPGVAGNDLGSKLESAHRRWEAERENLCRMRNAWFEWQETGEKMVMSGDADNISKELPMPRYLDPSHAERYGDCLQRVTVERFVQMEDIARQLGKSSSYKEGMRALTKELDRKLL